MTATTHAPDVHESSKDHGHGHALRLLPFFLALLALTAAEVGLYEWWRHSWELEGDVKVFAIPKFALVLLILVFTLPKAYIVLVYFMHLRFEKAFVVWLAVIPLMMTFLAVLPTLTDTATLKPRKLHAMDRIGHYTSEHGEHPGIPKQNIEPGHGDKPKGKVKAADDDY